MNPEGITRAMDSERSFAFLFHPDRTVRPAISLVVLVGLFLSGCTSIRINTAPDDTVRQKVRWTYAKQAITVHVSSGKDLNWSDKRPHTLIIGVAEVRDPNGFLPLVQNPDLAMETLASGKKPSGILAVRRFIIPPGTDADIVLDRLRHAMYLGIITGYSDYSPKKDIQLRPMPVRIKRSGIIFRSNHYRPARSSIRLVLGSRHLATLDVLDTRKKTTHPEKPSTAKTPSAIRPL